MRLNCGRLLLPSTDRALQLCKLSSVSDPDAQAHFLISAHAKAAALREGEELLLLAGNEQFLCVSGESGREGLIDADAVDAMSANHIRIVRLDGGTSALEVGSLVELRTGDDECDPSCLQLHSLSGTFLQCGSLFISSLRGFSSTVAP